MSEENKALSRRYLDEVWNKNNSAIRDEIASMRPAVRGAAVRVAFPDIEITIEDQIAEWDKVLSRMMLHGTHLGEYVVHYLLGSK